MSRRIYVVDTSYLLELFAVPGNSELRAVSEIRRRFAEATKASSTFIVPLPCIFELANHVADIGNGALRHKKAKEICKAVAGSFEKGVPWTITPAQSLEAIPQVLEAFSTDYVQQGVGLTDSFTIHEAARLKLENRNRIACVVHIWTRDLALKAREPDNEPDQFVRG